MPAVCELVCICGPSQPRKHPEGKAKQSGVSWSGPDIHKAVTLHGGVHVRQTRSPQFRWTPGSLTAEGPEHWPLVQRPPEETRVW